MKINIERTSNQFLMQATGASGNTVMIDHCNAVPVQGVSPMELLLMGVGSCSAIDIIDILSKQRQTISSYHVEVSGERYKKDESMPFKSMNCRIELRGDINEKKAQRAASLSFDKYCSVSKTLDEQVKITYELIVLP